MANAKGTFLAKAGGVSYTLSLGFSGLADLQAEHGQDVLEKLEPPEGASAQWVPDFAIVVSLVLVALQRNHSEEATRWTVDDLIQENPDLFDKLLSAAFPSDAKTPPRGGAARGGKPRRAKNSS